MNKKKKSLQCKYLHPESSARQDFDDSFKKI